jgi:hypothetical protein
MTMTTISRKRWISAIASLAMVGSLGGAAAARTQTASSGTARIGAQANLFNYTAGNGAVVALGTAEWLNGLVMDTAGVKNVRLAARAMTPGATVRLIASDFLGAITAVGPAQPIPVAAAPVTLFLSINMPASGSVVILAQMNNNALLGTAEYNP